MAALVITGLFSLSEGVSAQTNNQTQGVLTQPGGFGPARTSSFAELQQQLIAAKLKEIPDVLEQMQGVDVTKALPLFKHLLASELYYLKENEKLVVAVKNDSGLYQLSVIGTQQVLDVVKKTKIKKIKTNNRLRKSLRLKIARLTLFSEVVEQRLSSAQSMLNNMDAAHVALLKKAQLTEKNHEVLTIIEQGIALDQLSSSDANIRLAAVAKLKGSLQPAVKNKLQAMVGEATSQAATEKNAAVMEAARKSLNTIKGKTELYGYIERIFFGLSLGSILLLVAAGLAITFGVMGVINMAHGELIMLGAYTTYVVQLLMPNNIGLSIVVALPAAFIVSGLFGIAMERSVIQFLKGRPLETLLATFGISLILQQLVRTVFSPQNRQVINPEFMSGSLQINPVLSLTYNRLYILIFSLVVFALLLLILKKTALGLYVRAVSQNRDMARAIGIRSEWVDAMTFGLGSGIAGLAGVALSQITNVGPNLGQTFIIDSFMVVVFGGVGNLWGTLVGAFTLGGLNKFMEPATGAVLANIIVLVGIILFIQKKPRGLFPQKGRSADS
ncbi:MAG: urea ABC transporter permease subunit UrtB [Arenicella sp.]